MMQVSLTLIQGIGCYRASNVGALLVPAMRDVKIVIAMSLACRGYRSADNQHDRQRGALNGIFATS